MGSLKDIKARIVTQLQAVTDIGNVYARLPYVKEADQIQSLLVGTKGRVHVWAVTRESAAVRDEDANEWLNEQRDTILVHGYYAVADAAPSEDAFEALVDAVLAKLNTDRKPTNAGGTKFNALVETADPPFLRLQDYREYGNTLCHHCEIVVRFVPRYLQG